MFCIFMHPPVLELQLDHQTGRFFFFFTFDIRCKIMCANFCENCNDIEINIYIKVYQANCIARVLISPAFLSKAASQTATFWTFSALRRAKKLIFYPLYSALLIESKDVLVLHQCCMQCSCNGRQRAGSLRNKIVEQDMYSKALHKINSVQCGCTYIAQLDGAKAQNAFYVEKVLNSLYANALNVDMGVGARFRLFFPL